MRPRETKKTLEAQRAKLKQAKENMRGLHMDSALYEYWRTEKVKAEAEITKLTK